MRSGLLLLVVAASTGAIGYLEIRHQAAREAWRAEAVRLTGRLERADSLAEERALALSEAHDARRREKGAAAELATLEARVLDAAAELAVLESDRSVARDRAAKAMDDLKDQVRTLTTIEMDMATLDQRRGRLETHVETVEERLQLAEVGAAERQKRAESLDRDIAALAIRRETLQAKLKATERSLAEAALAELTAEQAVTAAPSLPEAPSQAAPETPSAAPVSTSVAKRALIDEIPLAEERDRTRGLYQFGSLSAEPEAIGGQGGLPPSSGGEPLDSDGQPETEGWAEDQYLLGLSLLSSAEQSSSTRGLNEAVLAFKAVLGEWPRERDRMRWAIAKSDLGYALALLGKRKADINVLEQAAAASHEALGAFERSETPVLWAAAQHHLGVALGGLADIRDDQQAWQESITALERSIAAFKGAGADTDAAKAEKRLREAMTHRPAGPALSAE